MGGARRQAEPDVAWVWIIKEKSVDTGRNTIGERDRFAINSFNSLIHVTY